MISFLRTSVWWVDSIACAIGLTLAVRAFKRRGQFGFALLGMYFVLALFYAFVAPTIHRFVEAHRRLDSLEHAQQLANAAVEEAVERVSARQGHPFVRDQRITFPMARIALVAAFWLMAREELPEQNPEEAF